MKQIIDTQFIIEPYKDGYIIKDFSGKYLLEDELLEIAKGLKRVAKKYKKDIIALNLFLGE